MTVTASLSLTEAQALACSQVIVEDPVLGGQTIDTREIGPDRWEIVVYFESLPDDAALRALDALAGSHGRFEVAELPETDWVAKSLEGLRPIRVGRFLVHGAHDRAKIRANDLAIEIEAGQAFGTGHHGTTAGCLAAIDRTARSRRVRNALDVGTGTGVLAIAIAKRLHVPVLASDIDPLAVKIARENAAANGVGGWVTAVHAADTGGRLFRQRGPFDLIVANILAGPLVRLAPGIAARLAAHGTLVLSGLLPGQKARIVAAYRGQSLALRSSDIRDEWLTLTFERQ